jgi:integrase/recombinase XerD
MVGQGSGYLQCMDHYRTFLVVEKGLSEKTIAAYHADLMKFGRYLEKHHQTTVSGVDTGLILSYLIHLRARGLSARSRARHLVSLRGFFKFLTHEKIIENNPARQVDLPKTGMHLPDVLTLADVEALLPPRTGTNPKACGMRPCLNCFTGPGCGYRN